MTDSENSWKEAAIAWEVCASLHWQYCRGKDPFFKTRQSDFVKHAEAARLKATAAPQQEVPAVPTRQAQALQRLREATGIDAGDVSDPLNPRYIAGFKSGHAAGRERTAPDDALDLLRKVAACFTVDDDLPDNLLPRIDAVLTAYKEASNADTPR